MPEPRVLTLKYRPARFDELWVQDHIRDTLSRAITTGRLANAYLFTGPRGVGKTSTARILARSLNCEHGPTVTPCGKCSFCTEIAATRSLDVIEIDGASNRGIDQIRELRESIRYAPSAARFKVYIIDEVHMLTEPAFNALLKTLEEPPAHAKFVFATTHAHEVPATIISRCQRFDFRKATPTEIRDRLNWLARQEHITASDPALMAIARRADGAIRDAESILDQLSAFRPEGIELADVEELLGIVPAELYHDYADLLSSGDAPGLLRFIGGLFEKGYDHVEFLRGSVEHFRQLLAAAVGGPEAVPGLLPDELARTLQQAQRFSRPELLAILDDLARAEESARRSQMPRTLLEVTSLEVAGRSARPGGPPAAKPAPASRPKLDSAALWADLRLHANAHRPELAVALDRANDATLSGDVLTIRVPQRHKAASQRIEADRDFMEEQLARTAARPVKVKIEVTRAAAADAVGDQISRVFGEVEERGSR